MSASLKFNEKLEQLNKFWFEKITKENEEKAKRENEEILNKPLALKIFDIAKDELKDKAKDTAKDTFEDYFSDKLDDVKKQGFELDKAIQVVQSLRNNNENPLNTLLKNLESDDKENDVISSDKENEKERDKRTNRMRLRDR